MSAGHDLGPEKLVVCERTDVICLERWRKWGEGWIGSDIRWKLISITRTQCACVLGFAQRPENEWKETNEGQESCRCVALRLPVASLA